MLTVVEFCCARCWGMGAACAGHGRPNLQRLELRAVNKQSRHAGTSAQSEASEQLHRGLTLSPSSSPGPPAQSDHKTLNFLLQT